MLTNKFNSKEVNTTKIRVKGTTKIDNNLINDFTVLYNYTYINYL